MQLTDELQGPASVRPTWPSERSRAPASALLRRTQQVVVYTPTDKTFCPHCRTVADHCISYRRLHCWTSYNHSLPFCFSIFCLYRLGSWRPCVHPLRRVQRWPRHEDSACAGRGVWAVLAATGE